MAASVDATFTAGDRLRPIRALLQNHDGTAIDLTGNTVVFRMINAESGIVKVNDTAAVIEDAVTGSVRYDWTAPNVDMTAEVPLPTDPRRFHFWAWFQRAAGGKTETLPPGRSYLVEFVTAA